MKVIKYRLKHHLDGKTFIQESESNYSRRGSIHVGQVVTGSIDYNFISNLEQDVFA